MKFKKSVLVVGHSSPPIHGQAVQYSQLIEGSKKWRHIEISTLNTVYAGSRDELSSFSLPKLFKMFGYILRMCWMCLRIKPELIVLSPAFHPGPFLKDSLFIWVAKNICRARVVAWIHMDPARMEFESQSRCFQGYARYIIKQLDLLVACSPTLARSWPSFLSSVPVRSVANGVVDHNWQRQINAGHESRQVIGYLSSLDRKKGWRELFDAAVGLCDMHPKLEFRFYGGVGAGETIEEIESVFSSNKHGSRIAWFGEVVGASKQLAFETMDLFCMPSHTEAFPLVVLEAMSYALPIVATDVGAVKDAVVPDVGGWLCAPENEPELKSCLEQALLQSEEWVLLGEVNRRRFLEHYSVDGFVRNWQMLIQDLVKDVSRNDGST